MIPGLKVKITKIPKQFKCEFCGNEYSKESTLVVHLCEKKRRFQAKNEKHVQLGYRAFIRYWNLCQNYQKTKSFDEFTQSSLYLGFVRFGSFLSNVDPLYPDNYIDYIVTSGIKIDRWCTEEIYYEYVMNFIKKESASTALDRSINTMVVWGDRTSNNWNEYFKLISLERLSYDIRDGKMSPWLLLNSDNGKKALGAFEDSQLTLVFAVLEPQFWSLKFKRNTDDIMFIKSIIQESGI